MHITYQKSDSDCLYFYRLNKTLNEEVGLHKGIFTFMNTMKTTIFESTFNVVAVVNAGRQDPRCKATIAAQKLSARAAQVEKDYSDGTISAADLLRLVAVHYDDSALIELMSNLTDGEVEVDEEVADLDLEVDSQESGKFTSLICF